MAIDAVALYEELTKLRSLAKAKVAADPIPAGEDARIQALAQIEKHGLQQNVAELNTQGYTVLEPGRAAPIEFAERLRDTIISIRDRDRSGKSPVAGLGDILFNLVPRDPVFEETILKAPPLALVTYLVGYRAILSQCVAVLKPKGTPPLHLHADHSAKLPTPWPNVSRVANVNWVLSDYTRENGAVCVWPGSHLRCGPVPADLVNAHDHPDVKVLEIPFGSVIVWHGGTWHGAVTRTNDDERYNLILPFSRYYVQAQEMNWATTTEEMIARNPARFSTLMGLTGAWPWLGGPDAELLALGPRADSPFE